jgi:hypothetical protein
MMQAKTLETISIINFPLVIKSNFSIRYRIILGLFLIISTLSIIALLIFCVWQINAEISEKYSIQKYRTLEEKLIKENNILESEFANANSLNNIASIISNLNFEKVEKINYIRVLNNQVVKK